MQDRAQEVGLFRYSLAREPADVSLSCRERGALVRALAAREHLGPDGRWVRVSRTTIDRWVRASVMRPSPVPTGPHRHKAGAERLSREPRQRCPEGSPKGRPLQPRSGR